MNYDKERTKNSNEDKDNSKKTDQKEGSNQNREKIVSPKFDKKKDISIISLFYRKHMIMRYFLWSTIGILGAMISLFRGQSFAAQSSTTVHLSLAYGITWTMWFTGSRIVSSSGNDYSSWVMYPWIISSTSWSIHRTLQSLWWTQSWSNTIAIQTVVPLSLASDGYYSIGWYLESISHGWYPLETESIIIDRTWPSYPIIASSYTANVGDTIALSRPMGIDDGIGWSILYHYTLVWTSPTNLWTIVNIQTSTNNNPLNTNILPPWSYTLTVSAYDLLANRSQSNATVLLQGNTPQPTDNNTDNNNGWNGNPVLIRDICLCRDRSNSYYDRRCSADGVDESSYRDRYCGTLWTGTDALSWWVSSVSWVYGHASDNLPSLPYIQAVITTLAPTADRIVYTQANRQTIIVQKKEADSISDSTDNKKSSVLGYSISRADDEHSWGITLMMNILKWLSYSHEQWNISTVCMVNENDGWLSMLWWRWLWIRYCSRRSYLIIIILIVITCRYTRLSDCRKKKWQKKWSKIWQKK